ncbi:uncharacterized protein LOC122164751 isoform X2 [Centrocercus urophasianus]|uniref:uncharacterized protein LOC122164751 isoform X2 n=1 Tax=Centrocercus urophasianus TaxID=9002 RepID=UPI001C6511F5|nr:uncharacterized protein LOC122164751 isoform X2 [Centrocercus urophasianus]
MAAAGWKPSVRTARKTLLDAAGKHSCWWMPVSAPEALRQGLGTPPPEVAGILGCPRFHSERVLFLVKVWAFLDTKVSISMPCPCAQSPTRCCLPFGPPDLLHCCALILAEGLSLVTGSAVQPSPACDWSNAAPFPPRQPVIGHRQCRPTLVSLSLVISSAIPPSCTSHWSSAARSRPHVPLIGHRQRRLAVSSL